jgi:aminopeptidase N
MIKFLRLSAILCFSITLVIACNPKTGSKSARTPAKPDEPEKYVNTKPLMGTPEVDSVPPLEYTMMDAVDIMPKDSTNPDTLATYNPSHTFEHDLLHTKIEIDFDWEKKRANGKATLRLKPWFYATNKLTLDAKNFDIKSVTLGGAPLKYDYNKEQIIIDLNKTYTRSEEFEVVVTYTAKPDERESYGGSAAITSDKGLYFINPDGKEADKPQQIWTQGETESNSYWFPTVDKPNERCTQEMYITVDSKYKTLSNGLLVSSKPNPNGTRTDYWKMDLPHAPYLFMMAIGDFAVVKDKWRGKDVSYYVEPAFEKDARDIFPYTTEMLEFFSTKLNYPYPWAKFDQVIVRDYVSGAMENTGAVIFGDYMQKSKRELLDNQRTNEKVVAHEMFHHWFGDLVTTESWANLTMNEGFANYSEYLWLEYKHGKDVADAHLQTEQQGYIFSATDGGHPLIHFGYANREDMFDAHSYNKGGSVLHMLRNYVGDEAFFAALNTYLKRNQFTDVEAHELRLAFEDVTGQDLSWFFNQWFFAAGHPSLEISYNWNDATKTTEVTIEQQQLAENKVPYVFNLPIAVDIYDAMGKSRREQIRVTKRKQVFSFKSDSKPLVVNVEADKALLCVKNDKHTPEEWRALFQYGPNYRDRIEALQALSADENRPQDLFKMALTDKSEDIRNFALGAIDPTQPEVAPMIAAIAEKDQNPEARATAIGILSSYNDKQYLPIFQKGLQPDAPYSVTGAALSALNKLDKPAAIEASKVLGNDNSDFIIATLSEMYAESPAVEQLSWFKLREKKVDQMAAFTFFEQYQKYLIGLNNPTALEEGMMGWKNNALTPVGNSEWRRFASTKALADTRNYFQEKGNDAKAAEIQVAIDEIKEKETDPTLKMYYGLF